MKFGSALLALAALISSTAAQAGGWLRTQGTQIVDDSGEPVILRGMGLGGWMLQEGYMLKLGEVGQRVLHEEVIGAGAAFRYRPGTVHRVTAIEDTTIVEVSTPHLDDVVRLEDLYGRQGTSEP